MNLSELLKETGLEIKKDLRVEGITNNSKEVKPGYMFFAVKGSKTDGNFFVNEAVERGASVVISENDYSKNNDIVFIKIDSVQDIMWKIAKKYYNNPSERIDVVGITGTNGKTTTAFIIKNIFEAAGIKTGILGTIEYVIGERKIPAPLTTPNILKVNQYISQMREAGCSACVMEISSHALEQGRVNGVDFRTGVFTNLGRDHLDYHKTVDDYLGAKAKLFEKLRSEDWAVINGDDPYSEKIFASAKSNKVVYGIRALPNLEKVNSIKTRGIKFSHSGMKFSVNVNGFEHLDAKVTPGFMIDTKLLGYHNVYNILAAVGTALSMGISSDAIRQGVFATDNVPGRLERIDHGQSFNVFVDFAHTPDALESALHAVRHITKGRIILVFGCGGDRDKEKRPLMGRVASRLADYTFITSDNPRSEDPHQIINEIEKGFVGNAYKIISDRKDAVIEALSLANPEDNVLIAGKGHENYQILKDTVIPFNDKDIAGEFFKNYAASIC